MKYNTFKQEGNILIHTRMLDAPRDLVWEVWTNPEHYKRMVGPKWFFANDKINECRTGQSLGFNYAWYGTGLG